MTRPWRWSHRASRLCRELPPRTADAAQGDLLEEYAVRHERHGRWAAEWWLRRELSSLRRAYRGETPPGSYSARRVRLFRRGDVVQSLRSLRRAPWYATTVAGVIAISLALATTVFAVVDGALFKPLPYREANRLFTVTLGWSRLHEPLRTFSPVSPSQFHSWQAALPGARLTAFNFGLNASRVSLGPRDYVRRGQVDGAFFDVVGVRPILGGFSPQDFQGVQAIEPAVVDYAFWRDRLAASPSAIGRVITSENGGGIRVVGVLPEDFVFPFPVRASVQPEILTPFVDVDPTFRSAFLQVLVRLGSSLPVSEAAARLSVATAAWAVESPAGPPRSGPSERDRIRQSPPDRAGLVTIHEAMTTSLAKQAWIVFAVAATLVLLACVNVTGLAIARIRQRWRDLTVRRSLGAGYVDLVRLLAIENAVLVMAGAGLGLVGARSMLAMTVRLMGDQDLLALKTPAIDLRVVVFASGVGLGALAMITLWSAGAAVRSKLTHGLADGGGGTTRRERAPGSILAAEVSLALLIAVAGALVAGSLLRVWGEDSGFNVNQAAIVSMAAPRGASSAQIENLISSINRVPGVASAGAAAHPVLEGAFNGSAFDRPADAAAEPRGLPLIESVPITHGYLEAAGLQPVSGRLPTDPEMVSGAAVIVVTQTVTRRYWPGQPAVGQTLLNHGRPFTVIGVVPDARYMSLDREPQGEIYWPVAATPRPYISNLIVRFDGREQEALGTVVSAIRQGCPSCWILGAQPLTSALASTIRPRQFSAWLFSAFGVSALVIVGTGILGLVAMTTSRRTRELGIRMALGATAGRVVGQLLREQAAAVGVGLVTGGLAAVWLVRFVESYLYKTPIYDPRSWLAAIGALLLVTAIGALIPSYRASRFDPVRAMRIE